MDDTLAGEVDKNLLNAVRDSIVQVRCPRVTREGGIGAAWVGSHFNKLHFESCFNKLHFESCFNKLHFESCFKKLYFEKL